MQPFWTMKHPKNIFDSHRIDFHTIHKFFPTYKDENEQEYIRLRKERLAQTVSIMDNVESKEIVQKEEMIFINSTSTLVILSFCESFVKKTTKT
jgi:hypothetical protein